MIKTFHYYIINVVLLFYYLYYHHIFVLILIIICLIKLILTKSILKISLLIILNLVVIAYYNQQLVIKMPQSYIYTVSKVNKYDYYIVNNQAKVLLKTKTKLQLNDQIKINGKYQRVHSLNNEGLFNYSDYLKTKKIFYEIKPTYLTIIKKQTQAKNENNITSLSHIYFNYIFLQDKEKMDQQIISSLTSLGIVHAFVVSGMHFNYLYLFIDKGLFFIKNSWLQKSCLFVLLSLYLIVLEFSIPATKAFFLLFAKQIPILNKLNTLDHLLIFALLICFYNPYLLLSTSFILSIVSSFFIYYLNYYQIKNNLIYNLYLSLLMLPLISNLNYEIAILAFVFNILFSKIMLSFYTLIILAKFSTIFIFISDLIIKYFEMIIKFVNEYNLLINTGYFKVEIIFVYLILLHLLISRKKLKYKLFYILGCCLYLLPRPYTTITYLNIGQGDTIIIQPAYSLKAMLIDPGQPYKAKTIQNITYPYLKSKRIIALDLVFITHDDSDHSGGLNDLEKLIKIEKLITKKEKQYHYHQYTFVDVLANSTFKDKNANSITLYTRMHGYNFLFTGDIDAQAELAMHLKLESLPVDVLKVAHHGSKTSSSKQFLNLTKPKLAIISSGYNNRYNHPHQEVITRLKNQQSVILNTACHGNINIYLNDYFQIVKNYSYDKCT